MRRKQLGAKLRELRQAAGVSTAQAAEVLDCSEAKIGHIETGRNSIRKPEMTVLLGLYGASGDVPEVLEDVRKAGSKRGWWATYRLPSWLQSYVGLEADAVELRTVELELVPGLLQTETYARRVTTLAAAQMDPGETERHVRARLERQRRLVSDDSPLTFAVVLSEAVLRRTLTDRTVAAEQMRHIETMAQRENVSVRVLSFDGGLHSSMAGSFVVLHFAPGVSLPVGYQEHTVGGHLVDDQDIVSKFDRTFDTLQAQALNQSDSLRLISEAAQRAESEAVRG
jgi:transcriptional regulator with XRE-family HTH domain